LAVNGTSLHLNFADEIATITFDQQGSRANTLSTNTWNELSHAITAASSQANIKGLVLNSAKDGMFLAGADLKQLFALSIDNPEATRALLQLGHRVLSLLEGAPFPSVAILDGACLGGGLEVALACDYRIAGTNPKVKIGLPEVKLGLIPGWGGTQRLPRIVGLATGAELLVTGRALTGHEAWQIGLNDVVHSSEELEPAANRCILNSTFDVWSERRRIKHSPMRRESVTTINQLLSQVPDNERLAAESVLEVVLSGCQLSLAEGLQRETDAFIPLLASEQARQKLAAFLKK